MRELHKMTWIEAKELIRRSVDTFILPIGTIEPHGTHLPLGTDAFIPTALAKEVAERVDAFVLPPVYYGVTKSLHGYTGSIRISPHILEGLIYDILSSMHFHGLKLGVIFNGHGGSEQTLAVDRVAYRAWSELKLPVMVVEWWTFAREKEITEKVFGKEGGHAGTDETACILARYPELVKRDLYRSEEIAVYYRGLKTYPFMGSIINYSEKEGDVVFDEEKARQYFEKLVDVISSEIERFRRRLQEIGAI